MGQERYSHSDYIDFIYIYLGNDVMFISQAYAQTVEAASGMAAEAAAELPAAPSAFEAFLWNMGLVLLLVFLFYFLLIVPQQRRLKEHSEMLQELKKGDEVVTGGGLVGKIDKIKPGEPEVVVDLGGGVKVTALRTTLHGKNENAQKGAPANDSKAADKKKADKKR